MEKTDLFTPLSPGHFYFVVHQNAWGRGQTLIEALVNCPYFYSEDIMDAHVTQVKATNSEDLPYISEFNYIIGGKKLGEASLRTIFPEPTMQEARLFPHLVPGDSEVLQAHLERLYEAYPRHTTLSPSGAFILTKIGDILDACMIAQSDQQDY